MLDIPHLTLPKTGKGQIGSILTNFVQFCTRTTRLNTTELFREVVLWLGGNTTCVWYERGVDAEFQSWKGGVLGNHTRSNTLIERRFLFLSDMLWN